MPERFDAALEEIANAAYLVDVYVEADDAYGRFRHTGRAEHLQRAASILCHGLMRLEQDGAVWHGFSALARASMSEQTRVFQVLEDVDTLITFETAILGKDHPLLELELQKVPRTGAEVANFR